MRRLLCTRRHVALDMADDYLIAWIAVQHVARAAGCNAWIFRGRGHEDRFIEFIEWDDAAPSPLERDDLREAMAQLESFGATGATDEWEEAT